MPVVHLFFASIIFMRTFCNSLTLLMISLPQGKDQEGSVVISVSSYITVL